MRFRLTASVITIACLPLLLLQSACGSRSLRIVDGDAEIPTPTPGFVEPARGTLSLSLAPQVTVNEKLIVRPDLVGKLGTVQYIVTSSDNASVTPSTTVSGGFEITYGTVGVRTIRVQALETLQLSNGSSFQRTYDTTKDVEAVSSPIIQCFATFDRTAIAVGDSVRITIESPTVTAQDLVIVSFDPDEASFARIPNQPQYQGSYTTDGEKQISGQCQTVLSDNRIATGTIVPVPDPVVVAKRLTASLSVSLLSAVKDRDFFITANPTGGIGQVKIESIGGLRAGDVASPMADAKQWKLKLATASSTPQAIMVVVSDAAAKQLVNGRCVVGDLHCLEFTTSIRVRTADERYIRALYLQMLERNPSDADVQYQLDRIAEGAPRVQIARGLTMANEKLRLRVNQYFQILLDRVATEQEKTTLYQMSFREMVAAIMGGVEYYNLNGMNNSGRVLGWYSDVLRRANAPQASEVNFWVDKITSTTVNQAALSFLQGNEAYQRFLDILFQRHMARYPSPSEYADWTDELKVIGTSWEEVEAMIAATDDAYARALLRNDIP